MAGSLISPATAIELTGIEGVDGAWVLDRFSHPVTGVTRVGLMLSRAKHGELGPPAHDLGIRIGEVLASRTWPDELVVVAVPSSSGLTEELARLTAIVLGRPCIRSMGVRGGLLGRLDGSVRGRMKVRGRKAPKFVLLVDDIVSSGETLSICAQMLRDKGAERVWAAATCTVVDESMISTVA